jgi:hypothetical protein
VLSLTLFRPLMILAYPLFVLLLFQGLGLRIQRWVIWALLLVALMGLLSMLSEGFFLYNYLLSLYLVFLPVFFASSKPVAHPKMTNQRLFPYFMKVATYVLLVINVSAVFYSLYMLTTDANPDDIFTGLYGGSGFGSHSLSIMNMLMAAYYFFQKQYKVFAFFFICGILGFYGQGLIIFVLSLGIVLIPLLIRNILTVLKIGLGVGLFFVVIYLINPNNLDYIRNNTRFLEEIATDYDYVEEMNKMNDFQRTRIPRYVTFMDGSRRLFLSDPKVFLMGTAPGTFNSRVAFYFNGDFLTNSIMREHFTFRSPYHMEYVFPVLNRGYLKYFMWNDGTRNQPFSSIVSVLLEYGAIAGGVLLFLLFSGLNRARRSGIGREQRAFMFFLMLYVFFLMFFQYYLEVIEIIFPMLVMAKLMEVDAANLKPDPDEVPSEVH